ncbi:MAG: hypothetical protein DCC51_14385 [Anaerolineae bacterium]|nr:MAG: hypothetical protein DCC51_14385 [Anaerolineae bacterium]
MKSSPSLATVLILIMLLMVVAAGFVFLFQAELRFRDHLRILSAENETLRGERANIELELSGAVATRDALAAGLAAAEGDTRLLEGQLVESQQTVEQLTGQVATLTAEVDDLAADLVELEGAAQSRPPVAEIVTPEDGGTFPVSRPIEIVLVAGDVAGLASLTLEVNGRRFITYTLDGEKLYARTLDWNAPAQEGEVSFTVSAVNINGAKSVPQSVTITLADTEARNAATRAIVEANVSEMRGLEPLTPIAPVVLTRDELRERLAADFATDTTPQEARFEVLELSAFDFLGRDFDLYSALLALQSEGILGFYDPDTAEFVVISDGALLDPSAQLTHAHEFVHALQDQHEEVESILNPPDQADVDFLREFPPVLVNDLAFAYTSGVEFVVDLYKEGGFEAIDAAWANPPASTEHILHPDRYRAGDLPQIVALAPLTDTLGAGWTLLNENVLGEFYLREYLDQQLTTPVSARAAAGWGGDRYAVYWNETEEGLVMAMRLVWDSPEDAAEFARAYPDYPAALTGSEASAQPGGSTCWTGDDVICFLQLDGDSLIARAPDMPTALAILATLSAPHS